MVKGASAANSEKAKIKKYTDIYDFPASKEIDFVPFAVEPYGTIGERGRSFLTWLASIFHPFQATRRSPRDDVDGLYGTFLTKAYYRVQVAAATGSERRFNLWFGRCKAANLTLLRENPMGPPAPQVAGEQDPGEDETGRREDGLMDEVDELMDVG